MYNLIKYELRKTLGLKGIIVAIMGLIEVSFLIGLFTESDGFLGFGVVGLILGSSAAIVVIGAYSIKLLSNDLNTKQAYMLFMTPNNSYKILGAKVIENYLSIIIAGVFFTAIGALDVFLAFAKYSSLKDFFDGIGIFWSELSEVNPQVIILAIATMIAFWLYVIGTAFFCVVVSATFLNGKKHNGLLSFLLFIVLVNVFGKITNTIVDAIDGVQFVGSAVTEIFIFLVLSALMYVATAWIMDNKLSV